MSAADDFGVIGDPLLAPKGAEPAEPSAQGERPASRGWGGRRRGAGRPKGSGDKASLSGKPKRAPGRPTNHAQRAERVTALYHQLGDMLVLGSALDARLYAVGEAIDANADALGEAWAGWADTSPRVAAMIDRMSFGGGALAVLLAHAPIVRALMGDKAPGGEGLELISRVLAGDIAGVTVAATAPDPT